MATIKLFPGFQQDTMAMIPDATDPSKMFFISTTSADFKTAFASCNAVRATNTDLAPYDMNGVFAGSLVMNGFTSKSPLKNIMDSFRNAFIRGNDHAPNGSCIIYVFDDAYSQNIDWTASIPAVAFHMNNAYADFNTVESCFVNLEMTANGIKATPVPYPPKLNTDNFLRYLAKVVGANGAGSLIRL